MFKAVGGNSRQLSPYAALKIARRDPDSYNLAGNEIHLRNPGLKDERLGPGAQT